MSRSGKRLRTGEEEGEGEEEEGEEDQEGGGTRRMREKGENPSPRQDAAKDR